MRIRPRKQARSATVIGMRVSTVVGSVALSPLLLLAAGIMEPVPAHAMSITCMPLYGHTVYDTMCIVYHDDGSVERFFVEP